jgi:hypothetical protein
MTMSNDIEPHRVIGCIKQATFLLYQKIDVTYSTNFFSK